MPTVGCLLLSKALIMPSQQPDSHDASEARLEARSTCDDDGGAEPDGPQEAKASPGIPNLHEAELIQLRVRVIALENLLIMLLAHGSDRQLQLACEMAEYISPRAGFTPHPLTTQAAAHMVDLVERAIHYRSVDQS
jgi:hypothetical protein